MGRPSHEPFEREAERDRRGRHDVREHGEVEPRREEPRAHDRRERDHERRPGAPAGVLGADRDVGRGAALERLDPGVRAVDERRATGRESERDNETRLRMRVLRDKVRSSDARGDTVRIEPP